MNNSKIINVRLMKKVLVLVLSFLSVTAFAQNITVKGIVKDGTGEPIIGGSVLVKGSSIGTVTDVDAITLYLMFLQTEFWSFLTSA